MKSKLAIQGGPKAVTITDNNAFTWPQFSKEDFDAVKRVMGMPNYTFYEEAYQLEREIREYLQLDYALPHTNGTAAIHAALFALGLRPGDEVIVPTLTYWASVMPVLACNAVPVFAESDPATLNIDPEDIAKRITSKTKAVVVVHLCGLPCDMDRIMKIARKNKIKVIEDCAHTHDAVYKGKKIGTIGDIGCFSYQATKLLPGIEGGMMVTNDREYYERAVALGHYERLAGLPEDSGYREYQHTCFGYKYRMHPLSAAILRTQMRKYDRLNKKRNENLAYLNRELGKIKGLKIIETPADVKRNFYSYRVIYNAGELGGLERDKFIAALQAEGLEIGKERYVMMHQQPAFNQINKKFPWAQEGKVIPKKEKYPVTEKIYDQLLSLPTFPQASKALMNQYIEGIKKVTGQCDELKKMDIRSAGDRPDMDWSKMQMPKLR